VAQVNPLVEPGSEKVIGGHRDFPHFSRLSMTIISISWGFVGGYLGEKPLYVWNRSVLQG
jgi:hypothetical protein